MKTIYISQVKYFYHFVFTVCHFVCTILALIVSHALQVFQQQTF